MLKSTDFSSPYSHTMDSNLLTDCTATVVARAADQAGNFTDSAVRTVAIDNAPQTTITVGPATLVKTTSATFNFAANQAGSTFECKLDAGAYAACTSPTTITGLSSAAHTYYVRAKDAGGQTDATPASCAWTVDAVAPAASLTAPAANAVLTGLVNLTATATDNYRMPKVDFFVGTAVVGSVTASPYAKSWNSALVADGAHVLKARATDAAGNQTLSAGVSVTVDNAPNTTIL
ncbi:MAG: Ig-like domain-containing protein [Chloroflexia bacterium]